MFRWGVLSTAKIGREHTLPAIAESSNGVVAAVASRDIGRARDLAERFGARHVFGSYDELLASPEVDGVYIPLPTAQHAEWAIKAADAGKHVLVEKPLALHASQIADVITARDRNRVVVSEAFMVFYHPQWAKVRELISKGAIGRLRHVQAVFSYYNMDPDNMRNRVELGGGALPDIGVYPTVVTRLATGKEPQRVQARVARDASFGTDVYSSTKADFGSFELTFYLSTQMAARQQVVFHGDEGYVEVKTPFNAGIYGDHIVEFWNRTHTEVSTFRFPNTKQYVLQAEAFVRAAQGEDVAVFELEDSVRNQKMIDAIFRASEHDGWEEV
ncbi:MAG: Gfo/Idh/MocA family oxidoreductase [Mesorhizobium sp.]